MAAHLQTKLQHPCGAVFRATHSFALFLANKFGLIYLVTYGGCSLFDVEILDFYPKEYSDALEQVYSAEV